MGKVKITETILRDGHQSLLATRLKTEDILPILDKMDKVGYHSLEMWGGATFDASLRFLNEDPWGRLRKIKDKVKNTPLQMLLRGQNLLGYKHYPDDVVEEFVKKSIANGIDIIRIFDALNDIRNLETAIKATIKAGGHAQAAISYTISPVHDTQHYIERAKQLEELGVDSICIKDMAGILTPYYAAELVEKLKKTVSIPIQLHTHFTSGMTNMTYLKAIEAGVDVIDTALSPLGNGTSQPATEPMIAALQNTEHDTGLDLELLTEITDYFNEIKKKFEKEGLINPQLMTVDTKVLSYQVPGGMLSNLSSQLKDQNALDKFNDVLLEVPRVREDLGYPPLVTPMSQMVGTQAVLNVLLKERYKMIPTEIKNYVKGLYGKPTIEISQEIKEKIIGNEEIITIRPADLLEPQLKQYKKEINQYIEQDEDILTYALFPANALKFFKDRQAKTYSIDFSLLNEDEYTYPV